MTRMAKFKLQRVHSGRANGTSGAGAGVGAGPEHGGGSTPPVAEAASAAGGPPERGAMSKRKSEGDASTRSGGRSPGRHNPYGRLFSDFAKNLENPNLELIHTSHYTVGIRTGMTLRLQCGPHCDTHTYSFIARPIPAPSPPPAVRSRLYGMSAAVAVSATL